MRLLRILCIPVLALTTLTACAVLNTMKNPVGRTALVEIESAYGLVVTAAVTYRRTCERRVVITYSVCRPIVVKLQQADRVAITAIGALRAFVIANPNEVNAVALVQAAWQAVEDFRTVAAANGVPVAVAAR